MTYDELMKEASDIMKRHQAERKGRRGRLLTREEVAAAIDDQIAWAYDIAAESRKSIEIHALKEEDCLGFVEVCGDDPSVNGVLFILLRNGLYKPYAWGGFPQEVEWDSFHASIRDVWNTLPEQYKGQRDPDGGKDAGSR